jgi:hypothetical protein
MGAGIEPTENGVGDGDVARAVKRPWPWMGEGFAMVVTRMNCGD